MSADAHPSTKDVAQVPEPSFAGVAQAPASDSAATAIRRVHRQQAALAGFGGFALYENDLSKILTEAARVCAEGLDVPFSKVCRYRPEANDLIVEAGFGWGSEVIGCVVTEADDSSPQGRAFLTGKPIICDDLGRNEVFKLAGFYTEYGIISTVDVVIQAQGEPYGVLEVDSPTRRVFDGYDINFLTCFANVLAEAVSTSHRTGILQAALHQMRAMVEDRDQLLSTVNALLVEKDKLLDDQAAHEIDLKRARDVAEAANRAKSGFLAGMSHELRTPLNGLLGYAQLLRFEGGLSVAQFRRVDAMLGAGTHLLQMINSVLDLSEIEAERIALQPVSFDLRAVANACLDLVRPSAEAKGLLLHLIFAVNAPVQVTTDPTRLRQVLVNLLGNAVKYTASGSIELRLHSSAEEAGLRIEVADTGSGISAEARPRLFRDFERLGADATSTIEGAGLGLAISTRLAAVMGGRLGFEDNPIGGSIFWLEIPLIATTLIVPLQATAPLSDVVEAQPVVMTANPLRVLVVDDVAMNRDIARAFLEAGGHEVDCAEGGGEAIASATAIDFDVILMDVRMPDMDGLEATRRIRRLKGERGRVPIVAVTAQAFAEQVNECHEAGMDSHLAKPFTLAALLGATVRAEESRRGHLEEASPSLSSSPPSISIADPELPILDQEGFKGTIALLSSAMVASHLQTIADRSNALLDALREPEAIQRSITVLADAAHDLAGSSSLFGFRRLGEVAGRFSQSVRSSSLEAPLLAESLKSALEASLLEIQNDVRIRRLMVICEAALTQEI